MAKSKARSQPAATSKTWVLAGGKVLPATGGNLPKDWTHYCNEGDVTWTKREPEKEVDK